MDSNATQGADKVILTGVGSQLTPHMDSEITSASKDLQETNWVRLMSDIKGPCRGVIAADAKRLRSLGGVINSA